MGEVNQAMVLQWWQACWQEFSGDSTVLLATLAA
jgi:hypothetical protein